MQKKNINIDPVKHLSKVDPVLAKIIEKVPRPKIGQNKDYFRALVEDIINQQLSDKASTTITGRFNKLFPQLPYTPEQILRLSIGTIRKVGVSNAKAAYIQDLARHVFEKKLDFKRIHTWSDEEVIDHLTQVKGIGRWTAEMFLMFSLGREDIFSYGDQGLKNAMQKLYKLKKSPTPTQAENISTKWRPFRTWACRYLWTSLDLNL